MKKILLQVSSAHWADNAFFKDEENHAAGHWRELKRQLADLGYDFTTADDHPLDDCAWIFFLDSSSVMAKNYSAGAKWHLKKMLGMKVPKRWPYRDLYGEALAHGLRDRMVFFAWEPSIVDPHNYDPRFWKKFDHIFTWNESLAKKERFSLFLPIISGTPPLEKAVPFSQKKLLANVSRNKYSSQPNESYGKRRKTIEYFTKHYPNEFDLYGTRWNEPQTRMQKLLPWLLVKKYSTYRGSIPKPVIDKLETLSNYKFTLCYENLIDDESEHYTEKIFDALCARSVPIYWGAKHMSRYVDADAFIDRRRFQNEKELAEFITKMKEEEYNRYLAAGWRYLHNQKYKKLLPKNFSESVIKSLKIAKAENG